MTFKSSAALASFAFGAGLLIAPIGASATNITTTLQLDDSANGFFAHFLVNGVEQLLNTSCGNVENCSLSEGFFVSSPTAAINTTVNFNVVEADGTTLSDFGTAKFFFVSNGSLQDFSISMNSKIDGFPITSPFTGADNPLTFTETGDFQTVVAGIGLTDANGDTNDVLLQFRSDVSVPEPSALALVGSGLLALIGFGRRRKARA